MRTQRRAERIMKNVNALKVRNQLGEILDGLDETGQPVLIAARFCFQPSPFITTEEASDA